MNVNAIEINNVTFAYSGEPQREILNINNWQVKTGEPLFIHGPSGSGKSTLLNMLCGLHLPLSGDVTVLGKSLNKMSRRQRDKFRADHIGYIFQKFNLIEYLHAIDNIKLATHFSSNATPAITDNEIKELLTALRLEPDEWYRPVNQLSVGQQQRVGIARALINKPKIIIADEPTSSLDEASKESFITILLTLCQQYHSTLLFVSHDMSLQHSFGSSMALTAINNVKSAK